MSCLLFDWVKSGYGEYLRESRNTMKKRLVKLKKIILNMTRNIIKLKQEVCLNHKV